MNSIDKKRNRPNKPESERSELPKSQEQQIADVFVKSNAIRLRHMQQYKEDIEKDPPAAPSPEFITELFTTGGIGRPPKYKAKEEMESVIEGYFKSLIVEVKSVETGETEGYRWFGRPTLSGLALWLGMDRQTLVAYNKRDEFSNTIKTAKTLVENFNENALHDNRNPAGLIFILKNGFSWRDIQDVRLEPVNPLGEMPDQKALEDKARTAAREMGVDFVELQDEN